MLSGTQALSHIDESLQTARNEIHRIDNELSQLTSLLTENRQQQTRALAQIAKVRLESIANGPLLDQLNSADQEVLNILQQREQTLANIDEALKAKSDEQDRLESQRQQLLEQANQIASELAEKEATIQTSLKQDDNYITALKRAQDADSIADEAERKAYDAAESLEEKGKPYLADDLFMYLWKRNYGTSEYKNFNPITRLLDGWVARKIKYHDSRANFWNIQEIPKRLTQHAEGVRAQAEALLLDIQTLEEQALEQGGAKKIENQLSELHTRIDQQDEKIILAENQLNDLLQQHGEFASGQDPQMQHCLQVLSTAMKHQGIAALGQIVSSTQSPDDDYLLDDLERYQNRHRDIQEEIANLRSAHNIKLNRLKELEDVRRNFKRHRYDDMRSAFGNDAIIGAVLGQFLEGLVSGSEVWRVIQRHQRHRDVGAWPDFGSGSLGHGRVLGNVLRDISRPRRHAGKPLNDLFGNPRRRNRRKSSWHWPNSHNGGFRLPTGRSKTGGFKTGGGF